MSPITTALTPELACTNLKISLAFYVGVLEFNVQYQRPEDGFAMLERQGLRYHARRNSDILCNGHGSHMARGSN